MSSLEDRLHDALTGDDPGRTLSPDLFDRVVDSIGDDRVRRRRLRRTIAIWATVIALATTAVIALQREGTGMPWWVLEIVTTLGLVAIALWLGPFIKRFGRAYAADVFHDNPLTGKSYIVLTDVVYYLIFTAYILFTVRFEPEPSWSHTGLVIDATAGQLKFEVERVGGILLIIGVLHGVNIVLMPVLGRLFSLNRRLPDKVGRL
ncbi:hypothetical protein SAMN05216199_1060 [Pedococcus cremeus]|uniref:Uncharacterized protein n=1 Tax=Pedococcus cremeus TaxID=587636 RepID=A0A1H9RNY1_9MICO|nr:hypothetical protein [Pedococcus cremeus]SER74387.1 hypothetical protein SAMN05216199_1060 [Pedococcus cremeus]